MRPADNLPTNLQPLEKIKGPVSLEMELFEEKFLEFMRSPVPLLDKITHYIVRRKGKQIRPLFVFLSAKLCGTVNESSYRAAALIELLHTATLVHDDVVDDSNERRGFFSVSALWKNKIAVLVGDYLLSRGLLLSVENKDFKLLEVVSQAVKSMSEGELLQIEKARSLDIEEKVYFDIIRMKTASLILACCACGAVSAEADEGQISRIRIFGEKAGIAFQIKDDLLDYEMGNITGKPSGIDIRERKLTLPMIYALHHAEWKEKKRIMNIIRNDFENPLKVNEVMNFVKASGGMEYASEKMNENCEAALSELNSFPESEARNSLEALVKFTVERIN